MRAALGALSAAMIATAQTTGVTDDAPAVRVFTCPMGKPPWVRRGASYLTGQSHGVDANMRSA